MDDAAEPVIGLTDDGANRLLPPALPVPVALIGTAPAAVSAWFDTMVDIEPPALDGSLAAEREAADAYASDGQGREHPARLPRRGARLVRLVRQARPAPPARRRRRRRGLPGGRARPRPDPRNPEAAPRRHPLSAPRRRLRVPTDDAAVSETMAGIRRQAARQGAVPRKKVAATAAILRQILAPISDDLRGLRDRALLLAGFAGALRRSELAAIRVEQLEKTERGLRLTLPQTKGTQTEAVIVPLPYGQTELCPVRALAAWQAAAGITDRPGVPPHLAAPSRRGRARPLPCPASAASRSRPGPSPRSSRPAPPRPGFGGRDFGGHSLKRGALTTGMDRGVHPAKLKRLGRHKSFDVLGEYLEFGDLFEGHPLSGVL